jgi:hypothetical protein
MTVLRTLRQNLYIVASDTTYINSQRGYSYVTVP